MKSQEMKKTEDTTRKPRVFVGISGGVDSSVSAALLQKQGYDVTGVFIETWQPPFLECSEVDDRRAAMRVCAQLNIPFLLCDGEESYKQKVVDYMISEYEKGRTPNPDIMCNTFVKFGVFFDFAMERGADYVATGHYAKVKDGILFKASDLAKDQSYFLSQVPKDKLKKVIFPIGEMKKDEVRKLAKKFKLFTAEKKDSQGLCFIGKLDMKDFIRTMIESSGKKIPKGEVLDLKGMVIGEHDGAIFYTIGERHGFRIATQRPDSEVLYVIKKDIVKNTISVGTRKDQETDYKRINLENVNIFGDPIVESNSLNLEYRYHGVGIPVQIQGENLLAGKFPSDISVGQIAVIYDGDRVVLSGIIDSLSS